jgi:hypothetical protein
MWFYTHGPAFQGMVFVYVVLLLAAIIGTVISAEMVFFATTSVIPKLILFICVILVYLGNIIGWNVKRKRDKSRESV